MTTKNKCCESCINFDKTDNAICDNPNCKCHQSDSVVEDKIALLKRYLLEAYPDPRPEHALCGLLDEIITTIKQTAQQEKEEAVKEAYDHAEIVRQRTINEIQQAVEDDIPYGGAKEDMNAILDRFIG